MWRSKKFILVSLVVAVLMLGSIGGVVFAQTENGDDSQPETLFDRVTDILVGEGVNITSEQLKDAFTQAQSDMRAAAMETHLAKMVEDGVIDETQVQEFLDWWSSKPDMPDDLKLDGRVGFRSMHGMRGLGPCPHAE